jgi:hypothetical protein
MSSASASVRPTDGSMATLWIFSGLLCATSSMSMPPSDEAISTTSGVTRSVTSDTYSSFLMSAPSSISRRHFLAFRAGLVGDQLHAHDLVRVFFDLLDRLGNLHAAALAAAASMDLRLDYPDRAAQLFSCLDGFVDRHARNAARNGHSELSEDFFALILMDFHAGFPSSVTDLEIRLNK